MVFSKNKLFFNFFELICVLILTAYGNMKDKIRMLFLVFDFDNSMSIDIHELVFITRNLIVGYGKMTDA